MSWLTAEAAKPIERLAALHGLLQQALREVIHLDEPQIPVVEILEHAAARASTEAHGRARAREKWHGRNIRRGTSDEEHQTSIQHAA